MHHASFRQLQSLVLVARHGSVSRAADAMHLTQPAISLQIRTLEENTGMALTRKVGRNIQLTAAGEVMVAFSERILRLSQLVCHPFGDVSRVYRRSRACKCLFSRCGMMAPPLLKGGSS